MSTSIENAASAALARGWWQVWPKATLLIAWLAAVLVGGWAIAERFLVGKELAAYSSYVPWGLWVAVYIYLIGLSAGAFLLSSLVYVFRVHSLDRLGRPALWAALVTLVTALGTIGLDLGHLERAHRVFVTPNFTSMIAWMIWLYTVYLVLLATELWLAIRAPKSITLCVVAALGVPLAVTFHGGVGALFGVVGAQPAWNSGMYPLLFLVGALTSGGGLLLFVAVAVLGEGRDPAAPALETLRKTLLGLVVLDTLFVWSELSIGVYSGIPSHAEVYRSILFGPYWYVFWFVHLGAAVVLPLVLLITGKHRPARLAAGGLLIAVGFLGVRLNLVIPDLVLPNLVGFGNAYRDGRLQFEYFPSLNEWAVTVGILAVGAAFFQLGLRYLPLYRAADGDRSVEAKLADTMFAPIDGVFQKRRGLLGAAAGAVGAFVAGWGYRGTMRRPAYATGGKSTGPVAPLPTPPQYDQHTDILYQMHADLDRALQKPVERRRWGMVIDTRKCIGCHACTIACVAENHLPPGVVYRPVLTEEIGEFPNLAMRFLPRPCMQCENPPCVPVCPVMATYMRPDGIVEIDYDQCIGCRYCLTACPYNARTADFGDFHTARHGLPQPYETSPAFEYGKEWDRSRHQSPVGNARKCHFCLHRLNQGMLPECVTSCVGRATIFGDLDDPESLVSKMSAQPNRMVLLEHLGTKPKVVYLV